jgi:hypothetical protein
MEDEKLIILWTSGDREVALNMVFMYALNSKLNGWWDRVTILIWGPSARLAVEDEEISVRLTRMAKEGIMLEACKACSDVMDVSEDLKKLGVVVKYSGEEMTEYLKGDCKVLSI